MNTELYKELLSSKIIKAYLLFEKSFEFTSRIKFIMIIGFVAGSLTLMFTNKTPIWAQTLMGAIFFPSVFYALAGGVVHYLAGRQIRQWSKKYDLSFEAIANQIEIIYHEK